MKGLIMSRTGVSVILDTWCFECCLKIAIVRQAQSDIHGARIIFRDGRWIVVK